MLDTLELTDSAPRLAMRELLLGNEDDMLGKLADMLDDRIREGNGEMVFDLGFENNGESLDLSKEEWDLAYERLTKAAKLVRADCQVLLTRNVGGEADVETKGKEKDCTGKIMIRQSPASVEDVIETRIAVVGNGSSAEAPRSARDGRIHSPFLPSRAGY